MSVDYRALADQLQENGGFSIDATGQSPSRGYMVSREGSEHVVPGIATEGDIKDYTKDTRAQEFLKAGRSARAHIGAWVEDTPGGKQTVLDLSQRFENPRSAMLQAAVHHQRQIYGVAIGDTITPPVRGGMSDAELQHYGLDDQPREQTLPWSNEDFNQFDVKQFRSRSRVHRDRTPASNDVPQTLPFSRLERMRAGMV